MRLQYVQNNPEVLIRSINMAENIVESFTEYLECLTDEYQPHIIYRGEFIARYQYSSIEETNNWIVWESTT